MSIVIVYNSNNKERLESFENINAFQADFVGNINDICSIEIREAYDISIIKKNFANMPYSYYTPMIYYGDMAKFISMAILHIDV